MVTTDEVVDAGMVATVLEVGGIDVEEVGASVELVVSGGGEVVAGAWVVFTGGTEVPRGAVVFTEGWVEPVRPDGMVATVVVDSPGAVGAGAEVDGPLEVVAGRVVVVDRTVVDDDLVATCCLGAVSLPVSSSTSRAARATAAMT